MNWDAVSAIGQFAGALAVVVTLIYLGIQIRQNSQGLKHNARATEVAAYQDMVGRIAALNIARLTNPELEALLFKHGEPPSN